ncbi:alpha/beta hydrolase [Thermomicrobium sp.]
MSELWHRLSEPFRSPEHQPIELPGRSPAFILIHGFMGTPAEWRPLAEILHRQGFTVSAPLLPGFGARIVELPAVTLRDWEDTLLRAASRISSHVVIVGFSLGGALATLLAARLQPAALVLLAPFSRMPLPFWYRWLIPLFERFSAGPRPFARVDFDDPAVRQALSGWNPLLDPSDPLVRDELRSLRFPWRLLRELAMTAERARQAARSVESPVSIVQGRNDTTVLARDTRKFVRAFGNLRFFIETPGDHQLVRPEHPAFPLMSRLLITLGEGIGG